jgi:hypothetical protein
MRIGTPQETETGSNRLLNLRTIATNSRTLSLIVLAHFVLLGIHAAAHSMLGVVLSDLQSIIVVLAMIVGPIVAVVLLYTTHRRAGISLLLAAMLSSFIFGLFSHFLIPGIDNILTIPTGDWRIVFQITTVLLGIVEAVGALLPAVALLKTSTRQLV